MEAAVVHTLAAVSLDGNGRNERSVKLEPPEPSSTTPRSRSAATAEAELAATSLSGKTPRRRMIIKKLVLENFKSYAGTQTIGPFHKSFSAIVGPNGSGKSNLIDALLFVFGFRASKMRQGKLSALIHNSAEQPSLPYCGVDVFFEEIEDNDGEAYRTVPGTEFVVSRIAYQNSSSTYRVNGQTSTYTQVTTMLKEKGIDLDHKRFLILQGEVESIAQLKPKAPNEHEDGLLEYLEDIIGTSKYKEPIEEAISKLETLNEVCLEKQNRLALVSKEKESLEEEKDVILEYIHTEKEVFSKKSTLYQRYMYECQTAIHSIEMTMTDLKETMDKELTKHAGSDDEIRELEYTYKQLQNEHQNLKKKKEEVHKKSSKCDREDVQLQERKKHLVAKRIKLEKSVQSTEHANNEVTHGIAYHSEEIEKLRSQLAILENNLNSENSELNKIRIALGSKTQVFADQIELKQKELEPWMAKLHQILSEIAMVESELQMFRQKDADSDAALEETRRKLKNLNENKEEILASLNLLAEKSSVCKSQLSDARKSEVNLQNETSLAYKNLLSVQRKLDEAKSALSSSQNRNNVYKTLSRLSESGRIKGFHGRLGDLGVIDSQYDVAVSTACPALDNLVVDTVEKAQQCISILRAHKLGRAIFIILDKLDNRNIPSIPTPENVPRLYDLIKPQHTRFSHAFYNVLKDTLVAKDLEQANRIAYGPHRWRVVDLAGNLIDKSGAMSGGGAKVSKGAMSSKTTLDTSPEMVEKIGIEFQKLEGEYNALQSKLQACRQIIQALSQEDPKLQMEQSKLKLDVSAIEKLTADAQTQLVRMSAVRDLLASTANEVSSLESRLNVLHKQEQEIKDDMKGIESQINDLQSKIMEVGGVRLRTQKSKVDGIRDQIVALNDRINSSDHILAKLKKDNLKHEKITVGNRKELTKLNSELEDVEKQIRIASEDLEAIKKMAEAADYSLEAHAERMESLKLELDERKSSYASKRAIKIEFQNRLEDHQKNLVDNERRLQHWKDMHEQLTTEVANCEEDRKLELKTFLVGELKDLNRDLLKADIAALEAKTENTKIDFSVLKTYKKRELEQSKRSADLSNALSERDAVKAALDDMHKCRLGEFMLGFNTISLRLKEMYQMITMGGNAELELIDSLDPFAEGIGFSVMPPKKSWKNISNLSGGEKTLSSLALVFALHHYKPTPLYVMDEIDAALDFRNVSIIANYIKERTKNAQFIIISLRNNMFELASRLVGIYKTANMTKSITITNDDTPFTTA